MHRADSGTVVAYDTVVFDLGRVLVGWEPYLALADRMTRDEWETFSAAVDFPAVNHAMDAGLPHADAIARVEASHPEHAATLARYCSNFAATLTGPVDGTTEIVGELASAGTRLVGLTNWSAETFHHAAVSSPVIERLEGVVVSGREGVVKPDPAIFRILVDRHGLRPEATVFVDDSPANVAGAEAIGIRGLVFTDAAQLRADLVELGLLPGDGAPARQNGGSAD
ncbi:HAD family hydrolase [Georgenia soli]|nr:HAD family phosphatase [Georgenia soli]